MPTSYLQTEEICTVNKARVLKCRPAAHLMEFFIPSYACTLQNIWGRQGKITITIPQASFILVLMTPIQRNQTCTGFCEIFPGETLGYHPRQGKSKGCHSKQQPGHCTHPTTPAMCAWCHGETAREEEDIGSVKSSPLFP